MSEFEEPISTQNAELWFGQFEKYLESVGIRDEEPKYQRLRQAMTNDVSLKIYQSLLSLNKDAPYTYTKDAILQAFPSANQQIGSNLKERKEGEEKMVPMSVLEDLQKTVSRLESQVASLQVSQNRGQFRSVSRSGLNRRRGMERGADAARSTLSPRSRSLFVRENQGEQICWYHRAYGDSAKRCREPCAYRQNENEAQMESQKSIQEVQSKLSKTLANRRRSRSRRYRT